MKLTVFRALILALIILEIGNVKGYDVSIWVYLLIFFIDCLYIWVRHLYGIWSIVNDYSFKVYGAVLDHKRKQATKEALKDLNKGGFITRQN